MQIDWITVAAQIVNFLVLAWLLHRFLYGPITRAMERREQRIVQRLSDADRKRKEAENEAHAFVAQQRELAERREQILAEARAEADAERKRLHEEARLEVEAQKQAWRNDVEQQRAEFLRTVRQRAQDHFFALARRALGDLADAGLEEQMSRIFRTRLSALDAETKAKVAAAGRTGDGTATIRSAFELHADVQRDIAQAVRDNILADAAVRFEQDPAVICGLELKMGGQSVGWSLASYFETLEAEVDQALGDRAREAD
jgi:F-type H+-transporting ATPase subunit b